MFPISLIDASGIKLSTPADSVWGLMSALRGGLLGDVEQANALSVGQRATVMGQGILSKPIEEKATHVWSSPDLQVVVSSMQGWRVDMEDEHLVELHLGTSPPPSTPSSSSCPSLPASYLGS